jgi:hypothetical protein
MRHKIMEFVQNGDFGLASGQRDDGTYDRIWFAELLGPDEIAFESDVFLLTKAKAKAGKAGPAPSPVVPPQPVPGGPAVPVGPEPAPAPPFGPGPSPVAEVKTLHVFGTLPPEVWNRLGTKLLPKLKSGTELKVGVDFLVKVDGAAAAHLESDLRQILDDLGLRGSVRIEFQ